jgi:hypothetical protein
LIRTGSVRHALQILGRGRYQRRGSAEHERTLDHAVQIEENLEADDSAGRRACGQSGCGRLQRPARRVFHRECDVGGAARTGGFGIRDFHRIGRSQSLEREYRRQAGRRSIQSRHERRDR